MEHHAISVTEKQKTVNIKTISKSQYMRKMTSSRKTLDTWQTKTSREHGDKESSKLSYAKDKLKITAGITDFFSRRDLLQIVNTSACLRFLWETTVFLITSRASVPDERRNFWSWARVYFVLEIFVVMKFPGASVLLVRNDKIRRKNVEDKEKLFVRFNAWRAMIIYQISSLTPFDPWTRCST